MTDSLLGSVSKPEPECERDRETDRRNHHRSVDRELCLSLFRHFIFFNFLSTLRQIGLRLSTPPSHYNFIYLFIFLCPLGKTFRKTKKPSRKSKRKGGKIIIRVFNFFGSEAEKQPEKLKNKTAG